jgi:hypothetical protein
MKYKRHLSIDYMYYIYSIYMIIWHKFVAECYKFVANGYKILPLIF